MRSVLCAAGLLLLVACSSQQDSDTDVHESASTDSDRPVGVEAISPFGDELRPPELPDEVRTQRERQLAEALDAHRADPHDADALIWYGRRLAYLGRYRDAIDVFTHGVDDHPLDPRMLRHRGHRWISVREPARAIDDLTRAARLVEGQPDQVEPDGLPNAAGIPTSTLQTNIWYHLGLAHYVQGDLETALQAYRRCLELAGNPDMEVATAYWLAIVLQDLERGDEARTVLEGIDADLPIIENASYHRLLLLFKGTLTEDEVLDTGGADDVALQNATVGFGVGHWHAHAGRPEAAESAWRAVLAGPQWSAFGYIAAEARLQR